MVLAIVPKSHSHYTIQQESDVYHIALVVKMLALEMGFSGHKCGLLALAVSELTMNVVRHGDSGSVIVRRTANCKGIEIQIDDVGSGIGDLPKAFTDGFSTYGSFGLGLGAARRSVDEMLINKNDTTGISITLRHYLPLSHDDIDVAAISFSATNENTNGDAYLIKEYEGDKLLAVVIDGAGKGEKASLASKLASDVINDNYKLPLDQLIILCDKTIKQSLCERPAEMCLLRLTPDIVEFVGIGNISAYSNTQPSFTFPIQNGSAGMVLPEPIHITHHQRPNEFFFVLHSDGVSHNEISSLLQNDKSAYINAQIIFDSNALAHDDATVMVIKG